MRGPSAMAGPFRFWRVGTLVGRSCLGDTPLRLSFAFRSLSEGLGGCNKCLHRPWESLTCRTSRQAATPLRPVCGRQRQFGFITSLMSSSPQPDEGPTCSDCRRWAPAAVLTRTDTKLPLATAAGSHHKRLLFEVQRSSAGSKQFKVPATASAWLELVLPTLSRPSRFFKAARRLRHSHSRCASA